MEIVLLSALGVGGATIFGSLLGFVFKGLSHKFSDIVLAFAAGVMLSASMIGLIFPSLEMGGKYGFLITVIGIFAGALCINVLDKMIPHLQKYPDQANGDAYERRAKVMLFVIAIGIHNLPEGIAAGVGFGGGNIGNAIMIAGGIALQNIPEGMVIIGPMLAAGISPVRTFIYAALTGVVEIVGTVLGYYAITAVSGLLPFALSFAGGTMLYIISDEIIPDTHADGSERGATYALLFGFCLMLVFNALI